MCYLCGKHMNRRQPFRTVVPGIHYYFIALQLSCVAIQVSGSRT